MTSLGKCKMCLNAKVLVSSHLMPRLLYDYCRKGEHRPIKVGNGVLIPTDRQTQDYILCQDCEDVLNQGGEQWIADKLATWERTFPLHELLTRARPLFDEDGMAVYSAAQAPEIDVDKLTHFALGIFWKASVHSWRGGVKEARIELGIYSEKIRQWLRSKSQFPDHLHLVVVVERPSKAQISMLDPYEGVRQPWRTHFFHVPGVLFMMALGKTVTKEIRSLALTGEGNPVNICDALTNDFEKLMVDTVRNSRRTAAYIRAKERADAERKKRE